MTYIHFTPDLHVDLEPLGPISDQVHVFEEAQANAINAAIAAGRPLLVRGEPGAGKSQLARAAAQYLKRVFVQYAVDSQTEPRDLFWHLDSLRRLAEAQLAGILSPHSKSLGHAERLAEVRKDLMIDNFLSPGPLWWAFDWNSAVNQAARSGTLQPPQSKIANPSNGCVLLIDELDKAETDVPNGLLSTLASGQITLPLGGMINALPPTPLVVITTNEERALPDAFIRRCLVLLLKLPDKKEELIELMIKRGHAHFRRAEERVLRRAAEMLAEDRDAASAADRRALPGQAEYLDLLRAVLMQYPNAESQEWALQQVAEYTLKKHNNG